jgi:hypothetical protein
MEDALQNCLFGFNLQLYPYNTNQNTCLFLKADFLKGLPVYNKSNFSRFHADSVCKASVSANHENILHVKEMNISLAKSESL